MKNINSVWITDTHLKISTKEINLSIYKQIIDFCYKNAVHTVFHLGDVFDSRKAQPLEMLEVFGEICDMFDRNNIDLHIIPGNHDKVDYKSEDSYLDAFKFHPYIHIYRKPNFVIVKGSEEDIIVGLIPYFEEETYQKYLLEFVKEYIGKIDIIGTHIGFNGAWNNEKSRINNSIDSKNLPLVFCGHYHDKQEVGKNVYYIGSTYQGEFCEDKQKGLTVLYDDLSFEQIQLQFSQYEVVEFNLDDLDSKQIDELLLPYKEYIKLGNKVRLKFYGDIAKITALDKNYYSNQGFDVKTSDNPIEVKREEVNFANGLQDIFKEFCDENGYDFEKGIKQIKFN